MSLNTETVVIITPRIISGGDAGLLMPEIGRPDHHPDLQLRPGDAPAAARPAVTAPVADYAGICSAPGECETVAAGR